MVNISAWTNMNGIEDLATAPNGVTGGLWGLTIFGILYFLMFIAFAKGRNDELDGFVGSSLVMSPVSFLMAILEIIPVEITAFPVVLSVIGVMVMAYHK